MEISNVDFTKIQEEGATSDGYKCQSCAGSLMDDEL